MHTMRFLSGNPFKIKEVEDIMAKIDINVVPVGHKINEIQTIDVPELVHDKCIKAFQKVSRPIFVEHTSLHISPLNGFPGGLTQVFWDTLQADRVAEVFGKMPDPAVKATTRIAYCDGKRVHQFEGEILGKISPEPRGDCTLLNSVFDLIGSVIRKGDDCNLLAFAREICGILRFQKIQSLFK